MPVPLFSVSLFAVGKIKDRSILEKIEDYASRLKFDTRLEIHEIKDTDKDTEGKKFLDLCKSQTFHTVVLSEEGQQFTSIEFSQYLKKQNRNICFFIGGPHGVSEIVKKNAHDLLSLSPMTFPHEIARMLLLEQLFRAVSIIKNRSYHK